VALQLETYDDWRRCITVDCGIPLTVEYCRERLRIMADSYDRTTQRFVQTWGDEHRRRVIGWFEQALAELDG